MTQFFLQYSMECIRHDQIALKAVARPYKHSALALHLNEIHPIFRQAVPISNQEALNRFSEHVLKKLQSGAVA